MITPLLVQNTRESPITPSLPETRFIFQVETHGKEGTRERYFADDDRYDLKEMVRREKMSTADDQEAMMAKLASKVIIETGTQLYGNYS